MKKTLIISLSVLFVLLLVLFLPIPKGSCDDGGTRVYDALLYKLVVWNRLQAEENGEPTTFRKTCIYFYPDNKKSIDEIFKIEYAKTKNETDTDTAGSSPQNDESITKSYKFTAHNIRTAGCAEETEYPKTKLIKSNEELEKYYDDNKAIYDFEHDNSSEGCFKAVIAKYDDEYFAENNLIVILLEEVSGSIWHSVISVEKKIGAEIKIEAFCPECSTDDVAQWHILIEVSKDFDTENISVVKEYVEEENYSSKGKIVYSDDKIKVYYIDLCNISDRIYTSCRSYNEKYSIFISYRIKNGENNQYETYDYRLDIIDVENGKICASQSIENDDFGYNNTSYYDGYCVIYTCRFNEEGQRYEVGHAYKISENNGEFSIEATEHSAYPKNYENYTSPDGKYTIYRYEASGWGECGIMLCEKGKEPELVLKSISFNETKSIGDVYGYIPVGFIDNTQFLFNIYGWEWVIGHGIYDTENKTFTVYEDAMNIYDYERETGTLYMCKTDNSTYISEYFKLDKDGTLTSILMGKDFEKSTSVYRDGLWFDNKGTNDDGSISLEILNQDRSEVVAKCNLNNKDELYNLNALYYNGTAVIVNTSK